MVSVVFAGGSPDIKEGLMNGGIPLIGPQRAGATKSLLSSPQRSAALGASGDNRSVSLQIEYLQGLVALRASGDNNRSV